jgi:threonine aldolase
LAEALRTLPGLAVDGAHTNMVFVTLPAERVDAFAAHMDARGIRVALRGTQLRLVTHLDLDDAGLARAVDAFQAFFR